jgi:hypothetical protein
MTLVGLFERSEFRQAPSSSPTRRNKRDTGGFFWLLFLTLRKVTSKKRTPELSNHAESFTTGADLNHK